MKKKRIKDPYDVELDEYEQDLEDNFELLVSYSPEEEKIKIAELVKMAKAYNKEKTNLSIDISTNDLAVMKYKAAKKGITLHKYISLIFHENAASAY